jgi:hypothetical protein
VSNVFLLYMPPGNREAIVHYQDTIVTRVPLDRIRPHVSRNLSANLLGVFGPKSIAVWGSQAGPRNRGHFERMAPGDDVIIVEGERIRLIGKVAAKTESKDLSRELWKTLSGKPTTWELIYFIANPRQVDVSFSELRTLLGWKPTFQLHGLTTVAQERLQAFYQRYDDLYSILERLQSGEPVAQKREVPVREPVAADQFEPSGDKLDAGFAEKVVSEHVRMQWTLSRLGLKAGERVWVPRSDQGRLKQKYKFTDFDAQFTTGIDLPHSYVQNIDVVWKQEFRIGAAYEIENSTSVYSGLLRFADLNVLAPNTTYPMFVVAPASRKNEVRKQVKRPAFHQLGLAEKVSFLSYETVDEIDRFFSGADSGLTIETIVGRAERLT